MLSAAQEFAAARPCECKALSTAKERPKPETLALAAFENPGELINTDDVQSRIAWAWIAGS
jgi:hypothetical protein